MTADAAPLGPVGLVRFAWTQLTSMRTALILLFALAVVAIPGSLVPQRPVNPIRVIDFVEANPALGEWYERLGLFDVYASPWFSAVYLLLFTSLVGCIIPRVAAYARALRTPPPRTPRHLTRLPEHAAGASALASGAVLDAAASHLTRARFRVRREEGAVAAERGYLREFGNLLFHVSLVALLVGVAWNTLWGYRGDVIVVEGRAFSNNLGQYDDFTAGGLFRTPDLQPFTIAVDRFTAKFETGPVQRGAARQFTAEVRVTEPGGAERAELLEVNHPVAVGGASVHLASHGYAPVVTVTDPQGDVAFSGPVVFLPQDGNFSSLGVVKAPDARPRSLAFEGYFLPTAIVDAGGPRSVFPDALAPELFLNAWSGEPQPETGRPQNVYSLDKEHLTQTTTDGDAPVTFRLQPGQGVELPDGSTLSFDDWRRWTKLQVSWSPGLPLALGSVGLAVLGLCLTLFVRPRRLWVRATDADGGARVEVGGLDRADSREGLAEDVAALAAACGVVAPANDDEGEDR